MTWENGEMSDERTPCERAGVHLNGTGHVQAECSTGDGVEDER